VNKIQQKSGQSGAMRQRFLMIDEKGTNEKRVVWSEVLILLTSLGQRTFFPVRVSQTILDRWKRQRATVFHP